MILGVCEMHHNRHVAGYGVFIIDSQYVFGPVDYCIPKNLVDR